MPRGGGGVCVIAPLPPPSTGGSWDSAGLTGTALGRPMRPLRVCGGRRCVYHLEPPRASTSRCGHRHCRASRHPAHLRTAPPCCPPALAIQTWGSGAIRGAAPRRQRIWRAVRPRVRQARRQQMPKGGRRGGGSFFFFFFFPLQSLPPPVFALFVGGGRERGGGGGRIFFFFFPVQCLTPPVCAFCGSRGRDGGRGGGSGPSTISVSTRALVAAGSAASGGGTGGGAPCALRPVLIPPGAPRGSQAPRAAWACARHAPRTLGGVGAC